MVFFWTYNDSMHNYLFMFANKSFIFNNRKWPTTSTYQEKRFFVYLNDWFEWKLILQRVSLFLYRIWGN